MKNLEKGRIYNRNTWKRRRDEWLAANGPCRQCGSSERLEVDHIDPATKERRGDASVWTWSAERRAAELGKCQVLCHECHLAKSNEERRRPLVHGTYVGYAHHGCRCDDCRRANREWARGYHARRKMKVDTAKDTANADNLLEANDINPLTAYSRGGT